jgi:hypothetical protein
MAQSNVDISGVLKVLDDMDFTSRQQTNIIKRVTRKGGNILKSAVKTEINDNGDFEHIDKIKRGVKVVTSKSKSNPGVNVIVKGSDVPVGQGRTRRFWNLSAYSVLVFFGNKKTKNRPTKGNGNRGDVDGTNEDNPFLQASNSRGGLAMKEVVKNLIPEIQKEIKKLKRK